MTWRSVAIVLVLLIIALALTVLQGHRGDNVLRTVTLPLDNFGYPMEVTTSGSVFLVGPNTVSAVDAETGQVLGHVSVAPDEAMHRIVLTPVEHGHVFVADIAGSSNAVFMLSEQTGTLLRTTHLPVPAPVIDLAIDMRTQRVFALTSYYSHPPYDEYICALEAATGRVVRCVVVGHGSFVGGGNIAIDQHTGRVFVGDAGSNAIVMLDGMSAGIMLRENLGHRPVAIHVDEATARVFVNNQLDGTVSMLNANTGHLLHTTVLHHDASRLAEVYPHMPVSNKWTKRIFIMSADAGNAVSTLDAHSGMLIHTEILPGQLLNPTPTVNERSERIFVAVSRRSLALLDARNGRLVKVVDVGQNITSKPIVDEQTGRVLVVDQGQAHRSNTPASTGTVIILDGLSGATIATIPVGVNPSDAVLNVRDGHALVVNGFAHSQVNNSLSPSITIFKTRF